MENDNVPEKQLEQSSSKPKADLQNNVTASTPDNSTVDEGDLPAEVFEALKELPQDKRQMVSSMVLSMERMSSSSSSALVKRVTSEHITQTLDNIEKQDEREFKKSQSGEITKRLAIGAILILVLMVFVYAGFTKDTTLAEKVIIAGISGLGGFGAGFAVRKKES